MTKVAHIYASTAKFNSGDFMIGIATKRYFNDIILKQNNIQYVDLDCRDQNSFSKEQIHKLNSFDYLLVGGGGLLLPDTNPNMVSCWQWIISSETLLQLKVPIYVVSIGYNLFWNQTMEMQSRASSVITKGVFPILKNNLQTLINKSCHFSMRHKDDIENTVEIVGQEYKPKIQFEYCPTIWYAQTIWKPQLQPTLHKYIAIEIKDDREWRRYHKIGKETFYSELKSFILYCLDKSLPLAVLSHDGSKNFFNFLKTQNIHLPLINNACANEKQILTNYNTCKVILCTAGHSQMIAYGLGIPTISIVTHPKVLRFCLDTQNENYVDPNQDIHFKTKLIEQLGRMIPGLI
jgi:hypothetical protein